MCGIFCLLSNSEGPASIKSCLQEFKRFEELIVRRGPNALRNEFYNCKERALLFVSSVLWLQGAEITIQPVVSDKSILIYNGDIFGGSVRDEDPSGAAGDTMQLFNALERLDDVSQTVDQIKGPYAFVYFDKIRNRLYFGRDRYGRRSLLIGKSTDNVIIITSVANRGAQFSFMEVPCTGIFCIDLDTNDWQIFPWSRRNRNFRDKTKELELFMGQEIFMNPVDFKKPKSFLPASHGQSEVLDSFLNLPTHVVLEHFCSIHSERIGKLNELLENSVKRRILTQPKFCQNCFKKYDCNHAVTGVLFSGGVDCAILALLSHNFIEQSRPIDLINVAFEKEGTYNTPDRVTGMEILKELQILCPQRKWRFVEVNVTRQELDQYRSEHISHLIYPLSSILDDSLGCALWFASRGKTAEYTSPCRTILVGMGADELFGGYTRHRAAFQKQGWEGLHDVLEEDWQNLPHRNLGRDDRVVSDHGRQLRTPYLDEDVVEFVQSLDCWEKTFPSKHLPQGIGEKILLRSLAYHLGLKKAAMLKKRALQFGSRIANSKEKGHEISERLQVVK